MSELQAKKLVRFDLSSDLGSAQQGRKVLGCYDIVNKLISIDSTLPAGDPRFPFTVAHELGHFYLHSKINLQVLSTPVSGTIRDTVRDIVVYRVDSTNPRTLMEYQANAFAAGLLLPRSTTPEAVVEIQRDLRITRNLGSVWLDEQPSSRRDHRIIVQRLAALYQVSRSVVRIRLQELNIIRYRHAGRPAQRLGALMGEALEALFSGHGDD